ncbi:hypothetical protein BD779DRAFT_1012319 [Infundibulicybe gibba]|nr:hypothetical protein BD779DRAFT_1012319 [Infundibulicybe gibba]
MGMSPGPRRPGICWDCSRAIRHSASTRWRSNLRSRPGVPPPTICVRANSHPTPPS